MNVLNPEVRQHEAWTPQEDERLRELVPQFTKEASPFPALLCMCACEGGTDGGGGGGRAAIRVMGLGESGDLNGLCTEL